RPSPTVPASSNSSLSRLTSPSATMAWSSASNTRARRMFVPSQRDPDAQLGPPRRPAVDPHAPLDQTYALVQANQPQAAGAAGLRRVEALAVVADGQLHAVRRARQGDPGAAGTGVPDDVLEGLLRDAVQAQRHLRGDALVAAGGFERHLQGVPAAELRAERP